jgi:hypothetical protein
MRWPQIQHVDEIEADFECLMCARVMGRLFGHKWRSTGYWRAAPTFANLTTYLDNEPGAEPRPVWTREASVADTAASTASSATFWSERCSKTPRASTVRFISNPGPGQGGRPAPAAATLADSPREVPLA